MSLLLKYHAWLNWGFYWTLRFTNVGRLWVLWLSEHHVTVYVIVVALIIGNVGYGSFWVHLSAYPSFCYLRLHDDVIKWKLVPRYWPFVRGIHWSPVNSLHKGQWREALMFSLIYALNERLSKQSQGWWFETPSRSLWRCNAVLLHINIDYFSVCLWQRDCCIREAGLILTGAILYVIHVLWLWACWPMAAQVQVQILYWISYKHSSRVTKYNKGASNIDPSVLNMI